MIYPKGIKKGDTIGIVAPSGPFKDITLDEVEKVLNNLGYNVKFAKSCYGSYKGYLSSEDKVRARDIEDMFFDKNIDGIFCLRGGYGTTRILDLIDYNIIKNNPKFFVGFSDITALHIAFNKYADLVTFHGVMAGTSYKWDEFTYNSLINALNNNINKFENPNNEPIYTVVKGECTGELIGGNLALITSSIGSKFEIDVKGKILFIEDVGESIYRLDRMLTQLSLAGKFDDCVGIVFGDFCDCNKENDDDFEILELIEDRVSKYNKPCIYNLKSGHCTPMITLPFGCKYRLNATEKTLQLIK